MRSRKKSVYTTREALQFAAHGSPLPLSRCVAGVVQGVAARWETSDLDANASWLICDQPLAWVRRGHSGRGRQHIWKRGKA